MSLAETIPLRTIRNQVVHDSASGPVASSLRSDATWALVGATAQAAQQAVFMVTLGRCLPLVAVGQYALGLAIATPLNIFADRAIRTMQATATEQDFPLRDYLGFRAALGIASVMMTLALLVTWESDWIVSQIVLLVSLQRLVEGLAQTLYGRLQRVGQMRRIGQSQIIRATTSLVFALVTLLVSRRLDLALAVGLMVSLLVLAWFDRGCVLELDRVANERVPPLEVNLRYAPWLSLLHLGLPLGVSTFLVATTASLPRLYLSRTTSEVALGIFTILCYVCFPTTLAVSALMQAATPRLSVTFRDDNVHYRRLCYRLLAACAGFATVNFLVVVVWGQTLVTLAFGSAFASTHRELAIIALASGIGFLATVPGTALVAQRQFRLSLVACAVSCSACLLACWGFVPRDGLRGAAWAMLAANVAHFLITGGFWCWLNLRLSRA